MKAHLYALFALLTIFATQDVVADEIIRLQSLDCFNTNGDSLQLTSVGNGYFRLKSEKADISLLQGNGAPTSLGFMSGRDGDYTPYIYSAVILDTPFRLMIELEDITNHEKFKCFKNLPTNAPVRLKVDGLETLDILISILSATATPFKDPRDREFLSKNGFSGAWGDLKYALSVLNQFADPKDKWLSSKISEIKALLSEEIKSKTKIGDPTDLRLLEIRDKTFKLQSIEKGTELVRKLANFLSGDRKFVESHTRKMAWLSLLPETPESATQPMSALCSKQQSVSYTCDKVPSEQTRY